MYRIQNALVKSLDNKWRMRIKQNKPNQFGEKQKKDYLPTKNITTQTVANYKTFWDVL